MNALPPPETPLFSLIGLELGVIYGFASVFSFGVAAVVFPLLGFFIGKILDQNTAH